MEFCFEVESLWIHKALTRATDTLKNHATVHILHFRPHLGGLTVTSTSKEEFQ
jgi:hypothetical protein